MFQSSATCESCHPKISFEFMLHTLTRPPFAIQNLDFGYCPLMSFLFIYFSSSFIFVWQGSSSQAFQIRVLVSVVLPSRKTSP